MIIKSALAAALALVAVWSASAGELHRPCFDEPCRGWDQCVRPLHCSEPCWIEPWHCCPKRKPWHCMG